MKGNPIACTAPIRFILVGVVLSGFQFVMRNLGIVLLVDDLRALGCEAVAERHGGQDDLADDGIAVLAHLCQ